jgi:hypothetical protein
VSPLTARLLHGYVTRAVGLTPLVAECLVQLECDLMSATPFDRDNNEAELRGVSARNKPVMPRTSATRTGTSTVTLTGSPRGT